MRRLQNRAELRAGGGDRYRSWSIQKVKCAGKTQQTMVVRRMFRLVDRCNRTAVRRMQAKLGERKVVKGSSVRELGTHDRQQ